MRGAGKEEEEEMERETRGHCHARPRAEWKSERAGRQQLAVGYERIY